MLIRKKLTAAGDTIVEVIIVLAVLGLALGISYATANRSLIGVRQAQENSQATALLQAQVEKLRALACTTGIGNCSNASGANIYQPGGIKFCVTGTSGNYLVIQSSNAAYAADCQNQDSLYDIAIVYVPNSNVPQGGSFTLTATWPDIAGQGTDTVTLSYRLYS